ncbi:TaqI-like C-terminal specificity domain-containing protein, partial [Enterococcus hulanensis]|uniref:TaqI-like C-terminal specificity domain-containing protein n=1 Tax=Enterococcus hulanensis TaxID=2559929 RepID=UPI00288E2A78
SDFIRQNSIKSKFTENETWAILTSDEQNIRKKIQSIGTPLKEWGISINYGVKTGLNEAFIISGSKRDELIKVDSNSKDLIKPLLRGRDIQKYSFEFADQYLITAYHGSYKILETEYPAIYDHLRQFEDKLKERGQVKFTSSGKKILKTSYSGQHHWLELDNNPSQKYMDDFSKQKIVWKRVGSLLKFSLDNDAHVCLDSTCFAVGEHIEYLVAFLNSCVGNYLLKDSPTTGTGDLIVSVQAIEPLKIPIPNKESEGKITRLLKQEAFLEIDREIQKLYSLTEYEMETLCSLIKYY